MTFLASSFLPSSSLIKHGVYVCVREKEKRGSPDLSIPVYLCCVVHAEGGMIKGSHLSLNMSLYQCMCVREKEGRSSCFLLSLPTCFHVCCACRGRDDKGL